MDNFAANSTRKLQPFKTDQFMKLQAREPEPSAIIKKNKKNFYIEV